MTIEKDEKTVIIYDGIAGHERHMLQVKSRLFSSHQKVIEHEFKQKIITGYSE